MRVTPYVSIRWSLDADTPIEGIRGIDSERVPVKDLVRWAKSRRKELRRGIKRAYDLAEREEKITRVPPVSTRRGAHRG